MFINQPISLDYLKMYEVLMCTKIVQVTHNGKKIHHFLLTLLSRKNFAVF